MTNERQPWDQQDGEPNRWYQRFSAYRLMGAGRTIEAVYRAECEAKLRDVKRPSHYWHDTAREWKWRERAAAWDQHLKNLAEAEIERVWHDKIMGSQEVLGRLSEQGRTNIGDFIIPKQIPLTGRDGSAVLDPETGKPIMVEGWDIDIEKVKQDGRLVKSIFATRYGPKIEMWGENPSLVTMGKHHRVFDEDGEHSKEINAIALYLPADLLAPSFVNVYRDIRDRKHMEYLLKGGRGSTKSSFASLALVYLLVNNPGVHALALRQVANTLRDSVYSQIVWAIGILGLEDKFRRITSPLEITYLPTGQKIYFRGADKPEMVKSIKPIFGHIGILWLEELDQFRGSEAVRKIEQSVLRGGEETWELKTYNPPRTAANWVNKYALIPKANQLQHHSTYLDVPAEWLGQTFIEEAEHLKEVNPDAYEHEYLGVVNGLGDQVFTNVQLRKITDEEISQFDHVTWGGDWGFYPDPADFGPVHYDAARRMLYIFSEYRAWKKNNKELFEELVRNHGITPDALLILDSAELKSVADFRQYSADGIPDLDHEGNPKVDAAGKTVMLYGPTCRGAEKGPESVKYSIKWLQGLAAIVIDPERCPYAATEFVDYAYERTKDGEIIEAYPDKNNHSIDRVRYATNLVWKRRGQ